MCWASVWQAVNNLDSECFWSTSVTQGTSSMGGNHIDVTGNKPPSPQKSSNVNRFSDVTEAQILHLLL